MSSSETNNGVQFHKFEKTHLSSSMIQFINDREEKKIMKKTEWVVTEKIHGANFQMNLMAGSDEVVPASRNGFIKSRFFLGYEGVVQQYSDAFVKMAKKVMDKDWMRETFDVETNGEVSQVTAYGELFGGLYPHDDVKPNTKVDAIQQGIFYTPNLDFFVFDIGFFDDDGFHFLDFPIMAELVDSHEMKRAPLLFQGTFTEAVNQPYTFTTNIPALFDLPEIENNIAEGIVCRPVREAKTKDDKRCTVKIKTEAFQETRKPQWEHPKKLKSMSENLRAVYHLAEERATAQRLDNVISKFGTPNEDDREDVIRLLSEDILEALLEDEPDAYVSLEQFEMGRLNKELKLLADEVCGDSLYFMSISEKEKLEE